MKQALLNSILGHIALSARDRFDLLRALLRNPESAGTIVNDWIAFSLVTKLCLPGKIFVDVGAHIGSVISEVHRNDKRVQIVAIEAIPEKAERLRRTFPFARIHQCAVGEAPGQGLVLCPYAPVRLQLAFTAPGRGWRHSGNHHADGYA